MGNKVKVLVGYHKPATLLKDDVFVPIHLGRTLATEVSKDGKMSQEDYQWMLDNMIGDDTGDNISKENLYLNELSAFYWAWKNYDRLGNPEYIGFMHYRRHLCFDKNNKEKSDKYGLLYSEYLNNDYLSKYKLNSNIVKDFINEVDIVVAEKTDLKRLGTKTTYNHYKNSDNKLHIRDLDMVIKVLLDKYPHYENAVNEYLESKYAYFTNIFIAKKEIFFEYCEWLFDVIFEAQKVVDTSKYNLQEMRVLAYISEWLWGIFLTYKKSQNTAKISELKRTFVINTDIEKSLKKRCDDEISIIMSTDNNYSPYLGVTIKSLIENSSEENEYTVYVLDGGLNEITQKKLNKLETRNVKIKYIDIKKYFNGLDKKLFYLCDHFSIANYYRFFIPKIFKNFGKVIYCDCDAIFLADVAGLYKTNIGDNILGAVHDTEVIMQVNSNENNKYYSRFLNLINPYNYLQSGMMLMNINKMIEINFTELCLKKLKELKTPKFVDQCVINAVCEGQVYFLDNSWNVENHIMVFNRNVYNLAPYETAIDYYNALENPKYLHFTGYIKPWHDPSTYNADLFWQYARMTPFYEEILFRNNVPTITKELLSGTYNYRKNMFKYYRYKVLSKITFGKTRKRYKQKRKDLKLRLNKIREFIKG